MVRSEIKRSTVREDYSVRRVIKEDKDWGRVLFRPASVQVAPLDVHAVITCNNTPN